MLERSSVGFQASPVLGIQSCGVPGLQGVMRCFVFWHQGVSLVGWGA